MKSFLKYTLATIVGVILSSFILFLLSFGLLGAMISATDKPVVVRPNSILLLKINQAIPDRGSKNPWDGFDPLTMSFSTKMGLDEILENIKKAKTDENITGIFIETGMVSPGISTTVELRDALADFKESGKFILSYSNDLIPKYSYYLSTVADSLFLNPVGVLEFFGLRSEITFYKNALEKLGVEMQIIRRGQYKSAVEPYINEKMSKENRDQILGFLNPIWNEMLEGISEERDITVEELNNLADNLTINSAEAAFSESLVDGLKYSDEIQDILKELSGLSQDKKLRFISMSNYSKVPKKREHKGLAKDKIAVIFAEEHGSSVEQFTYLTVGYLLPVFIQDPDPVGSEYLPAYGSEFFQLIFRSQQCNQASFCAAIPFKKLGVFKKIHYGQLEILSRRR